MRTAFLSLCALSGTAAGMLLVSTARADAVLTFDPPGGPCNGTVTARGDGFPANVTVLLELGKPEADTTLADLASAHTDAAGSFRTTFTFPPVACEVVAPRSDHLAVYADQAGAPYDMEIYTRAEYAIEGVALPVSGQGPSSAAASVWPFAVMGIGAAALVLAALGFSRRAR